MATLLIALTAQTTLQSWRISPDSAQWCSFRRMFRSKVGTRQAKLTSFLGPPPSQPRERIPRVEATAAPTSLNFWTCTYCTFVNHNMDAPVCLICGGERAYFDSTQQPSGHLDVTSVGPALEKRAPDTHETDPTQEKKRRIDRCGQIGSFGGTLVPRSLSVGGSVGGYSITPTPNPHLDGLYIILDFIDANTEAAITAWLDSDVGNPWQPSTFNGRHLSKTWGVRTDLSTGVTRLPTASEPTFPPSTGELNVVVEKLRAIDFGQLVKSAKTWFPNEANANM